MKLGQFLASNGRFIAAHCARTRTVCHKYVTTASGGTEFDRKARFVSTTRSETFVALLDVVFAYRSTGTCTIIEDKCDNGVLAQLIGGTSLIAQDPTTDRIRGIPPCALETLCKPQGCPTSGPGRPYRRLCGSRSRKPGCYRAICTCVDGTADTCSDSDDVDFQRCSHNG